MKFSGDKFSAHFDILAPTAAGVIVYVILSLISVLLQQIPHFQRYLNLPNNWHVGSAFLTLLNDFLLKLFGTSRLDTIVLSLFWVGVGLVVYLFLKAAVAFFVDMAEDIAESAHFIHPRDQKSDSETHDLVRKGFFQLVVLIIAIFYFVWMVEFFAHGSAADVPFFGQLFKSLPIIRDCLLFFAQCVAWYFLTIFLRLLWMRRRLLG
jgi:hypothetical protein